MWFIFVIFACAAWVRFTIWFMLDCEGDPMPELTLREAAAVLSQCTRSEIRDHAFGDAEVWWTHRSNNQDIAIAQGYFGGGHQSVYFGEFNWTQLTSDQTVRFGEKSFKGVDAVSLRNLGTEGIIERNDETGPDGYIEGRMLDSMTKGAVFEELTGNKLQED